LNIASVWDACSFVIENNGYGLQHQQMSNTDENLADKGIGYGMESHIVDGNNIGSFNLLSELKASMKENQDVLLEFKTFRMRARRGEWNKICSAG
jgi:2-oxoisovalerate dehydrogenase E1 component